jgi:hypothetical protein
MDSSDLQHALQLHFTPAMYTLTRHQNTARKLNAGIFQGNRRQADKYANNQPRWAKSITSCRRFYRDQRQWSEDG